MQDKEQDWSNARAELRRVKQTRAEREQELGRNLGGARDGLDSSLKRAEQKYSRGRAEAGAGEK